MLAAVEVRWCGAKGRLLDRRNLLLVLDRNTEKAEISLKCSSCDLTCQRISRRLSNRLKTRITQLCSGGFVGNERADSAGINPAKQFGPEENRLARGNPSLFWPCLSCHRPSPYPSEESYTALETLHVAYRLIRICCRGRGCR